MKNATDSPASGADASAPGDPEMGFLADHIGFQVHIARRALRQRMRLLQPEKDAPPPGTISILALISSNPGISQQTIAELLFLDASKVALLVRQLEKAGLVIRERSRLDRRRSWLLLTPSGRERLAIAREFGEKQEGLIDLVLTPSERADLLRLLGRLQVALR